MPTANIPTNRTTANTPAEHVADHNGMAPIVNHAQVVVRWSTTTNSWEETRPTWAPWGVIFDGSNDVGATFPPSATLLTGDKLDLHPLSPLLPQNQ